MADVISRVPARRPRALLILVPVVIRSTCASPRPPTGPRHPGSPARFPAPPHPDRPVDLLGPEGRLTVALMWFVGAPLHFATGDDALVPTDADVDVEPIRPGDRHVTLVFLGRVPDDTALQVWRAVPPLRLPSELRAVRWARFGRSALALELSDDDGLLASAAGLCEGAAEPLVALQRHPVYRPHVTMARVPRRSRPPSTRALEDWPLPAAPIAVGAPTLYRSNPQPTGDRYELVAQQPTT